MIKLDPIEQASAALLATSAVATGLCIAGLGRAAARRSSAERAGRPAPTVVWSRDATTLLVGGRETAPVPHRKRGGVRR